VSGLRARDRERAAAGGVESGVAEGGVGGAVDATTGSASACLLSARRPEAHCASYGLTNRS
jgi:hypothetical protein